MAAGGKAQLRRNFLYRTVAAPEQDLGPLDLGKDHIVAETVPGVLPEFPGDVRLAVPHHGGQIGSADALGEVHLDVVHAFLDRNAQLWVGTAVVDPVNEIIVHFHGDRVEVIHAPGTFRVLDIGVSQ